MKWIPEDLIYCQTTLGSIKMIKVDYFFPSLKNTLIDRYVKGINDHSIYLLDEKLGLCMNIRKHYSSNYGIEPS